MRKLYAMSQESAASPHEAEIALRRCQSLMQRFGLTEADLATSSIGHAVVREPWVKVPAHVQILCAASALLHDCLAIDNAGVMEFRGYQLDADVAAMTYDYLATSIESSLRQRKRLGQVAAGRSASYDYRIGFASTVLDRSRAIDAERHRVDASTGRESGGTTLAVRKLERVRALCESEPLYSHTNKIRFRRGHAHSVGARDGSMVSLNARLR